MALSRENRLPLRFERDRISREGKTFYSKHLTLVTCPNHSPLTPTVARQSEVGRFGILLSKKIAKLAVDRNLIRRRVSAAIAEQLSSFPIADYLIIPKRSVLDTPHSELTSDIALLLSKLK